MNYINSNKNVLGVGYGQVISTGFVATYYVTIMAITLHYFYNSFKTTLPWAVCLAEWGKECTQSSIETNFVQFDQNVTSAIKNRISSAELYYS